MSSDVQTLVAHQQLYDYTCLAMTIAIGYDYCLTFSKEITYIWKRPWTRVSTLFLLIRYVGYLSAFTSILFGTTFIPGPVKTCNIIYTLNNWLYALFWLGADMLMILRVYAIYNRSRTILHVLLTVYIAEVIAFIVATCIYSDPKYILVSIFQVLDITVCATVIETRSGINLYPIIQCIPSAILSIMVVAQSMKQSLQMYRVTRKWELNRYVALLVRDGVLYFFVALLNGVLTTLSTLLPIPQGWPTQVLLIAANVPLYTLTPRFVMNVRELYVRDTQGRWNRDIDTGFGLSSGVRCDVGVSTTIGTIAFAEGGATRTLEDREMVMMEERVENSGTQVIG